jgi:hypothetical protein
MAVYRLSRCVDSAAATRISSIPVSNPERAAVIQEGDEGCSE